MSATDELINQLQLREHFLVTNIKALFKNIGDEGVCKGCQRKIWWVTHKNGKKAPYTEEGQNHFIDCEAREQFRKKAE